MGSSEWAAAAWPGRQPCAGRHGRPVRLASCSDYRQRARRLLPHVELAKAERVGANAVRVKPCLPDEILLDMHRLVHLSASPNGSPSSADIFSRYVVGWTPPTRAPPWPSAS